MKKKLLNVLQYFIFIAIGVLFLWLALRGSDLTWEKFSKVLRNDINYWWVGLSLVIALLSHVSRAIRWQMMLKPLGHKLSFGNSFHSIMVMYFANIAVPRSGEVARCTVVKRYDKIPISHSLGTVFVERVIDLVILLLLTAFIWFAQYNVFMKFFNYSVDSNESF